MGSGRDKRKKNAKKTGDAVANKGAAKAEAKTAKKTSRRAAAAARAADDDLDALLKAFELSDAAVASPVVTEFEPGDKRGTMPPRAYASATVVDASLVGAGASSSSSSAVIFYGGERFEVRGRRETLHTFGDLWVYFPPAVVPAPFSSSGPPSSASSPPGSPSPSSLFDPPKIEDPGRWMRVVTPAKSSPPPRSSHQAVLLPCSASSSSQRIKGAHLYVFGGELTSKDLTKFRHYRDLYRLQLGGGGGSSGGDKSSPCSQPWSWESLPTKGGPSARSGHRMVAWGNDRFLVFGGFHDDGSGKVEYFNDCWCFDTARLKWEKLETTAGPSPRGGCQMLVAPTSVAALEGGDGKGALSKSPAAAAGAALTSDTLFVFGGHTAGNDDDDGGETGTGKVHDDVWALTLPSSTSSSSTSSAPLRWTRLARSSLGFAPTPRASFGLAANPPLIRRRAILWGGIVDRAGARDRLFSEHLDDLYAFNVDLKRWFPIALRGPPPPSPAPGEKKQRRRRKYKDKGGEQGEQEEAGGGGDDDDDDEDGGGEANEKGAAENSTATSATDDERRQQKTKQQLVLEAAATRIQSRYRGHAVRRAVATLRLGGGGRGVGELIYSPALLGPGGKLAAEAARRAPRPRARAAPTLVTTARGGATGSCADERLWLFGGVVEVEHTDVTLDDVWCLDLKDLRGWVCVRAHSGGEAAFEASDWETDDDEEGADGE